MNFVAMCVAASFVDLTQFQTKFREKNFFSIVQPTTKRKKKKQRIKF